MDRIKKLEHELSIAKAEVERLKRDNGRLLRSVDYLGKEAQKAEAELEAARPLIEAAMKQHLTLDELIELAKVADAYRAAKESKPKE